MGRKSKVIYLFIVICLFICIFQNPTISCYFAYNGLKIWFEKMVPTLLPFMILSDFCIRLCLSDQVTAIFYPFLHKLLGVTKKGAFVVLIGFLCGFPLGAKTIADFYQKDLISYEEARYLLVFCNNIGPIFFITYALPTLHKKLSPFTLFGMFGIPFLYGILLYHFSFLKNDYESKDIAIMPKAACISTQETLSFEKSNLIKGLNQSIQSSVTNIVAFMGYMVFFNFLNLLPFLLTGKGSTILAPLLEITGGIHYLKNHFPAYCFFCMAFGGFSCIAQTYYCISDTHLSKEIFHYIKHKFLIASITFIYFFLCFP